MRNNNVSVVIIQGIASNKFATADLRNKMANTVEEISFSFIRDLSRIKDITREEKMIRAEGTYGQPLTFVNHAKIIFSANELPSIQNDTLAIWQLMTVFHFRNPFYLGGTNYIPHDALIAHLTSNEAMSELLNVAIEGMRRFFQKGRE